MAQQLPNADILQPLSFSGQGKSSEAISIEAKDLIREILARQQKYGWSNRTAMGHLVGALKGQAATWYHEIYLSSITEELHQQVTEDINQFLPDFRKRFHIRTDVKPINMSNIARQGANETPDAFLDRVSVTVLRLMDTAEAKRPTVEPEPLLPEVVEHLNTLEGQFQGMGIQDYLTNWLRTNTDKSCKANNKHTAHAIARRFIADGLNHPELQSLAHSLIDKDLSLYHFLDELRLKAARLENAKTTQPKRFNRNGNVNEVEANEQDHGDDISDQQRVEAVGSFDRSQDFRL